MCRGRESWLLVIGDSLSQDAKQSFVGPATSDSDVWVVDFTEAKHVTDFLFTSHVLICQDVLAVLAK